MLTLLMSFIGLAISYKIPIKNPELARQMAKDQARREHFGRW